LELALNDRDVRLLPLKSAFIGRPSTNKAVDIPVGCRWLSRGDKNLRLFCEAGQWFVEDLGSTNGTSIGHEILIPGTPLAIPAGETVIEVGKRNEVAAPVSIRLRRATADSKAIMVSLCADEKRLSGVAEEGQWLSWREDVRTHWVVFEERVRLGTSEECDVVLTDSDADSTADIAFEDGFWISPLDGVLTVAETPFTERTPLPAGADFSVGNVRLRAEALAVPAPAEAAAKRVSVR